MIILVEQDLWIIHAINNDVITDYAISFRTVHKTWFSPRDFFKFLKNTGFVALIKPEERSVHWKIGFRSLDDKNKFIELIQKLKCQYYRYQIDNHRTYSPGKEWRWLEKEIWRWLENLIWDGTLIRDSDNEYLSNFKGSENTGDYTFLNGEHANLFLLTWTDFVKPFSPS